jgi:hypothetical protein
MWIADLRARVFMGINDLYEKASLDSLSNKLQNPVA